MTQPSQSDTRFGRNVDRAVALHISWPAERQRAAFGLEVAGMFVDDSRPVVAVRGQLTPEPRFTLNRLAVEKILRDYASACEE